MLRLVCVSRCWRHIAWGWRFYFLARLVHEILVCQVLSVDSASFVSYFHGQSELQIQRANLAKVFILATRATDASSFVDTTVAFPLKDGEGTEADTAFLAIVLFEHAHVRILTVAFFAGYWKIALFPALFVNVGLYRHSTFTGVHFKVSFKLYINI